MDRGDFSWKARVVEMYHRSPTLLVAASGAILAAAVDGVA